MHDTATDVLRLYPGVSSNKASSAERDDTKHENDASDCSDLENVAGHATANYEALDVSSCFADEGLQKCRRLDRWLDCIHQNGLGRSWVKAILLHI